MGNKKLRILNVCYVFDYGGIRAFITNSLKFIDRSKFDIDIYTFGCESSPFEEFVHNHGACIYFEPENNARKNIPRFVSQIVRFIKEKGPYDVVHAHCNLISAWVLLAAKIAGVPVRIAHSHTSAHFGGGFVQRSYAYLRRSIINRLASYKVACGYLAGETMYGKGSDFSVLRNGIDVRHFIDCDASKQMAMRKKLQLPDNVKVYANVSRLDFSKNIEFAVEIFNEIRKIDPNSILICGGVNPLMNSTEATVKQKIVEYGLNDSVRFIGPLQDIEVLYHICDVWLFCSRYEGFPFAPIELQASGVPCLVSDTVTKEIDLGLGLVEFISLKESPTTWALQAVKTKKSKIDPQKIANAFKVHNLDICESVIKLENVYRGSL